MKFDKMIKKMLENPKLEFTSYDTMAHHQTLNTLEFWYFRNLESFDNMVIAEDWYQEKISFEEKYGK